ncbi:RICIN domain-containing protein [Kitasatospora sp. NPDC004531]
MTSKKTSTSGSRIVSILGTAAAFLGAALAAPAAAAADSPATVGTAAVNCKGGRAVTYWVTGGSTGSGLVYLNVGGGSRKGAKVITWPWSGGKGNEKWCLTDAPQGGYNLRPWDARHLCLDVPAGRYKEGQGLIVWDCNNGKNQAFSIRQSQGFYLISPWENGGLFVHRGANAEGSQVSLWKHQNWNARWR